MKLPDVLTLSRLVLAAVLIGLLTMPLPYAKTAALIVFLIASLTDILDGELARRVYGESDFGRLMDPLTDKVLVCAAFVAFVELKLVPAWIVVLIITREFLVTGLRLLLSFREDIAEHWAPDRVAWFDTFFPYLALTLIWLVAVITALSGFVYFYKHHRLLLPSGATRL